MRAVSLHRDVIVVTSQLFQAHCTIVRGPAASVAPPAEGLSVTTHGPGTGRADQGERAGEGGPGDLAAEHGAGAGEETFVIDSPVLPEELELLGALMQQAGFPQPRGLLATHADFDHVLGPLAFPEATLGCAESSAERLHEEPGAPQRELRRFDEELLIERPRPLSLSAVQALAVPGRCDVGEAELELHEATGHTSDGMAIWIPWARVLVAGDYLSSVELPGLGDRPGMLDAYLATLERLHPLVAAAEHVVPGHGPVLDREAALGVLDEDVAYLQALREHGAGAELPQRRRSKVQRELHEQNVARLAA
ncbi:MAG TPA: MBL fold metallo-hydrolase [Solirubrobacteraceae bacterium]|jgi:glyoxylase-like metal-dependent hydrolase (beta-lactamase superfamily II)|nr:MBL fold metallo-hydrolase [Solirubrobacteraceae bacterium]